MTFYVIVNQYGRFYTQIAINGTFRYVWVDKLSNATLFEYDDRDIYGLAAEIGGTVRKMRAQFV